MPTTVEVKCKTCKEMFTARVADRKRGWARFCSKSCKAVKQESRTGQYKAYMNRDNNTVTSDHDQAMFDSTTSHGQDGTGGI